VNLLIDSDTHLFEPSGMWQEYVDPADRDVALHMEKDDLGYTWLMFGDRRLSLGALIALVTSTVSASFGNACWMACPQISTLTSSRPAIPTQRLASSAR